MNPEREDSPFRSQVSHIVKCLCIERFSILFSNRRAAWKMDSGLFMSGHVYLVSAERCPFLFKQPYFMQDSGVLCYNKSASSISANTRTSHKKPCSFVLASPWRAHLCTLDAAWNKQAHQDMINRIEVERCLRRSKRCFGFGLIMEKLEETVGSSAALGILLDNLIPVGF